MASTNKNLKKAEALMNEGKDFEAMPILNKLGEGIQLSLSDQILLSSLFIRLGNWVEAYNTAEQAYQKTQHSTDYLQSINVVLNMAFAKSMCADLDKASNLVKISEQLYEKLSQQSPTKLEQIEAYIAHIKGVILFFQGNSNKSMKYITQSLELREKIGNKYEIAESLNGLATIYNMSKSDFDQYLLYIRRCHEIAEEIHYQRLIAYSNHNLGVAYYIKGDFEKSLSYYGLALKYFEKTNDLLFHTGTLSNIALVYREKGELDKSIELMEKYLAIQESIGNNWMVAINYANLIQLYIDKAEIKHAQEYLERFKKLKNAVGTPQINNHYRFSEALILKTSLRTQNRAKAEKLLRLLIREENAGAETKTEALIHLCDLLLDELKITSEMEIIEEIKPLINELLELTEKSRSYRFFAETYVLQAKLALLTLNLKEARYLFSKAQDIAEKYGYELLGQKISNEHDDLLKKLDLWEKLKESNASIEDRLELVNLSDQTLRMIRKTIGKTPSLKVEKPVLLVILTRKGSILLFNPFTSEMTINENNLSEFLSSFTTLSDKAFSEKFDRVKFGDNTILIRLIDHFTICYMFQGQTYSARQKLVHFSDSIKKNMKIKEILENADNKGIIVKISETPSLEELIIEGFMSDPKDFQVPFKAYVGDEPFTFVSYAHTNKLQVYPIIDTINNMGINIWYDEGIPVSENWKKSIVENLERCSAFLVFITPQIIDSEYVRKEISFALKKKKPFIGVYLKETELPSELEFEIADIQSIMKYLMSENEFYEKINQVLSHTLSS